jgi:hypothetical protein
MFVEADMSDNAPREQAHGPPDLVEIDDDFLKWFFREATSTLSKCLRYVLILLTLTVCACAVLAVPSLAFMFANEAIGLPYWVGETAVAGSTATSLVVGFRWRRARASKPTKSSPSGS